MMLRQNVLPAVVFAALVLPCTSLLSPLQGGGISLGAPRRSLISYPRRRRATSLPAAVNVLGSLPTCTVANVNLVALTAGCTGLVSQLVFTEIFKRSRSFRDKAAYTAHSVVALALMVAVSAIGIAGWWCLPSPSTPASRLILPEEPARWLAAVITGMFCIWDVPTSLWVRKLRKPDVIIHHIVMAAVAWTGAVFLPMHYLFFYLGVSELSSIPLVVYDQLCVMTEKDYDVENDSDAGTSEESRLVKLRDQLQPVAALSFTWIRAFLFTKITLLNFVPDVLKVLPSSGSLSGPLKFGMVSSIGFASLQLFWFSQILRVIFLGEKK